VLLLQGSADANGVIMDNNVSPEIQRRFAASYQAAGGEIQLVLLPGAPHNFVNMAGSNLVRALGIMRTFIAQQVAGGNGPPFSTANHLSDHRHAVLRSRRST